MLWTFISLLYNLASIIEATDSPVIIGDAQKVPRIWD